MTQRTLEFPFYGGSFGNGDILSFFIEELIHPPPTRQESVSVQNQRAHSPFSLTTITLSGQKSGLNRYFPFSDGTEFEVPSLSFSLL